MRIAIIEQAVLEFIQGNEIKYQVDKLPAASTVREEAEKLQRATHEQGHSLQASGNRHLRCKVCGNRKPLSKLKWWIDNGCDNSETVGEQGIAVVELEEFSGTLQSYLEFLGIRKKTKAAANTMNR